MAGNHRSGRKRLPIEIHLRRGSYRKDRHGPLPQPASGVPKREGYPADEAASDQETEPTMVYSPNIEDEAATELYQHLEALLAGVVMPEDTPQLTMMCEIWSLYQQALAAAKADPLDKAARHALLGYLAAFDRLACRFGMTPSDRAKLGFPVLPAPQSKVSKYIQ
jgi:phage terminase small subunit